MCQSGTAAGRLLAGIAGLAFAACSSSTTGTSGSAGGEDEETDLIPEGGTVTWLETARPARDSFVLRGTIPVPRRVFPRPDGRIPFQILDWNGTPRTTQMEIVTRYPRDEEGASVVEVLAPVSTDPGIAPGEQVRYGVVVDPADPFPGPGAPGVEDLANGTADVPAAIAALLADPHGIAITAVDCFGHEYTAWPLDGTGTMRLAHYGPSLTELVVHQVMTPVAPDGGPQGTLPHFFGVHSYLRTYANEEVLGLDVRFHNAHAGRDRTTPLDDPLDKVYFERIEIAFPAGFVLQQDFPDPFFGAPEPEGGEIVQPIVAPLGDGTMHVLRWQGQFHRRLMLSTPAAQWPARFYHDHGGFGFATRGFELEAGYEHYSWWNRGTARYFPQSFQLPRLDHVGTGTLRWTAYQDYEFLRTFLAEGTSYGQYPVEAAVMGWGHPYGVAYGGMTGGSEIWVTEGLPTVAGAAVWGLAAYRALHRMQMDRMPYALYELGGEPTSVERWLVPNGGDGDYVPFEHFVLPLLEPDDPFGFDEAPRFQIDYVEGTGRQPDYYGDHMRYDPYDYQHHVRATRGAKALAWLANDALAKDDLRLAAEMFHLSFHPYRNSGGGGIQSSGMRQKMEYVAEHPGKGLPFGRGEGWGLDAAVAAFATASPEWRAAKRPWLDRLVVLLSDGQASCSGFLQSQVAPKFLDGRYHARQAIEQSITENALRGLLKTVYARTDSPYEHLLEDVLEASLYAFVSRMAWFPGEQAPWSHTAVAPLDEWAPIWCRWTDIPADGYTPVHEDFQNWPSFAYAYERTGDSFFLTKAAEERGEGDLLTNLEQDGLENLENKAALLALMQRLNGDL
ncbi:MAG: hypothetical protein AB1726_11785 [Planctomycetota bacterium]